MTTQVAVDVVGWLIFLSNKNGFLWAGDYLSLQLPTQCFSSRQLLAFDMQHRSLTFHFAMQERKATYSYGSVLHKNFHCFTKNMQFFFNGKCELVIRTTSTVCTSFILAKMLAVPPTLFFIPIVQVFQHFHLKAHFLSLVTNIR